MLRPSSGSALPVPLPLPACPHPSRGSIVNSSTSVRIKGGSSAPRPRTAHTPKRAQLAKKQHLHSTKRTFLLLVSHRSSSLPRARIGTASDPRADPAPEPSLRRRRRTGRPSRGSEPRSALCPPRSIRAGYTVGRGWAEIRSRQEHLFAEIFIRSRSWDLGHIRQINCGYQGHNL
jgi:hypothetical protein